ncbi:AbrB/MazE/SpoVT family DNA-binding domain-containing protein [Deinococcus navajonensis]|uniref:AbrB/MazE/SpoVT family DNA-binding domain-containing protein n=1 Tax=Deinococcus navajonensis TaxID=309884 RepID=A0ABV8XRD6_9DEIO
MTKIAATVDQEGRLTLTPAERERLHLTPGSRVIIEIEPASAENPFLAFIGSRPPLDDSDSRAHYRRERGHDE